MSVVLVVEDDTAILRGVKDNLEFEGYEVLTATDGQRGYALAREKRPNIVILDVMMPKMSGLDVCRRLRADGIQAPILMLTAKSEESDRVLGLDTGADDYLCKPFSIPELLARVRAHLRREHTVENMPAELRFGGVAIDFRRYEARKNGRSLDLTRKEFGLLRALAARAGEVVNREDLLNSVWGLENYPTTRTVDNHIASLRAKLEENPPAPRRLVTVHGVGYKLQVDP